MTESAPIKIRTQKPPIWGVMFHDGSVRSCWNGKTALRRALDELEKIQREYPGDNIDLAYRSSTKHPWIRLKELG